MRVNWWLIDDLPDEVQKQRAAAPILELSDERVE
jgi:hypothetical protein